MIEFRNVSKHYDTPHGRKSLLRDFSLTIPQGAKLALMGRNGAGKSSLLGMISGTVPPSHGRILRTGTMSWPMGFSGGFAADMTGRQNTLFVARIYGVDADRLLRFVQDFSELGGFIDMPLRSYSSGMRARLAFGISMGLGFDWYLIDEVTSVGDSAFRKKSLETFQSRLSQSGLVMVSHSLSTLREYCTSGIVLEGGTATYFADLEQAIEHHERNMLSAPSVEDAQLHRKPEFFVARARDLMRSDRFDDAEESIAAAFSLDPELAEGHALLAQIRQKLGDQQAAIAAYQKAIAIRNEPKYHLALAKLQVGEGEVDLAQASLRLALELEPENASAAYMLGRLQYQSGDVLAAEGQLLRALELDPDSAGSHRILAQIYDNRRDYHRSVKFHAEVARLLPENVAFLKGYARALESCGERTEADHVWKRISLLEAGSAEFLCSRRDHDFVKNFGMDAP